MKYCLVFYDPGTWNTLLEVVNVYVCWVGGVCCWWSSSDKGKVAFYQNSIISMEGGWGLSGLGCLFFSQVKIWREVGDLVAFMFLWCDKRQLTGETVRDQILFYAFLYRAQTLVLISWKPWHFGLTMCIDFYRRLHRIPSTADNLGEIKL